MLGPLRSKLSYLESRKRQPSLKTSYSGQIPRQQRYSFFVVVVVHCNLFFNKDSAVEWCDLLKQTHCEVFSFSNVCRNPVQLLGRYATVENVADPLSARDHVPLQTVIFSADGRAVQTGNVCCIKVPSLHTLSSFYYWFYLLRVFFFQLNVCLRLWFSDPCTRPSREETQKGLNPHSFFLIFIFSARVKTCSSWMVR